MKYRIFACCLFGLINFTVDAQQYLMNNTYSPKHTHSLYRHYYNRVFVRGYSEIDKIVFLNKNIDVIETPRKNVVFLRYNGNDSAIFISYKIHGKTYIEKWSVSDNIPLPNIRVGRVLMEEENIGRLLDSIYADPSFGDHNNNNIHLSVMSYVVEIYKAKKMFFAEFVCGNKFTKQFMEKHCQMVLGDVVIFKSIVVMDDFGKLFIIPEKKYTLW